MSKFMLEIEYLVEYDRSVKPSMWEVIKIW